MEDVDSDAKPPRHRRRLAAAWALGLFFCLVAGGLVRHAGDRDRYPLVETVRGVPRPAASTFNPGRWDYRTWWSWRAISTGDFAHVYDAARAHRLAPDEPMYRPHELADRPASFVYTPFAALLVAPFAGPDSTLERTADAFSVVWHLLVLACLLMLADLALPPGRRGPVPVGLALLAGVAFFPFASALALTQLGALITFGACLSAWLLARGRALASGLALALAVSIKPHLVVVPVLCWVVGGFRRSFFAGVAAGLLATAGASLAWAGWENAHTYVSEMLPALSAGYPYYRNQSLHGLLLRVATDQDGATFYLGRRVPWVDTAAGAASVALLAANALVLRRRQRAGGGDPLLVLALATCAAVLASPLVWMHHFGPFAIAAAVLWRRGEAAPSSRATAAALLAGWLLLGWHFDASGLANGPAALASGLELYGAWIFLAAGLAQAWRAGAQRPAAATA